MSIWNRLSVQFVLLVLCVSAVATVAGSLILDSRKRAQQLDAIEEEVAQLVEIVSIPAVIAAYNLDTKLGREIVAGLVTSRRLSGARIVTDFGDELAAAGEPIGSDTVLQGLPCQASEATAHRIQYPLSTVDGRDVGFMEVAVDYQQLCRSLVASRRAEFLSHTIASSVIAVVITIAFLLWFVHPLLRLHAGLTRVLAHNRADLPILDHDQLTAEIAVPPAHRNDEFGALARTIRLLAERYQRDLARSEDERNDLRISLSEKEALLREIHHRVKNNLQIILSLLSLQSGGRDEPEFREVIQDIQARVFAMSLVHEHLYQSQDLSSIDLAKYTGGLVDSLRSLYDAEHVMDIQVRSEPVQLDLSRAILYGLVLNELISNAFKYGHRPGAPPAIHVRVAADGETVSATIRDSGPGLSDPSLLHSAPTLGLRLVHGLAEQLQGRVTYTGCLNGDCGAQFVLSFPQALDR